MKVVIIGSGNVATVLGRKIKEAGNEILQVAGRNEANIANLAAILGSSYTTNLLKINTDAHIYIIAVSDNIIGETARQLKVNNKIVVHTAGSVSKDVLQTTSTNYGVLYPLQSLKKEMQQIPPIPVLVDGSNIETIDTLKEIAQSWAETMVVATDNERLRLHVAAVFASNFTNHLLALTEHYCKEQNLSFNVLYPLIEETVTRTKTVSPALVQTGPAVRKDFDTINSHLQILNDYPRLRNVYQLLTDSIISFSSSHIDK